MEDYTSPQIKKKIENDIAKDPEKKVKKIVTTPVKTHKKSELQKFASVFMAEDLSKAKDYVLHQVVIPTAKQLLSDVIMDTVHIVLWGNADDRRRGGRGTGAERISYRDYTSYSSDRRGDRRDIPTERPWNDFDDVSIPNRTDAENVLDTLRDIVDRYGRASVADFDELVGIKGPYTHNDYGWTDLSDAKIVRTYGGDYMIKLPRVVPINGRK